jgi:SAM-dependent methyltransferase
MTDCRVAHHLWWVKVDRNIKRSLIHMEWYEFYDIAERHMELINPSSPGKVIEAGQHLGMKKDDRIIDFGCGFGEPLALWAEHFGISGIGIDFRPHAVERARQKMIDRGFADRIEIVQAKGAEYEFEKHSFDVGICLGASFIWNGYRPTLQAIRETIKPTGKLLVGEPYLITCDVPSEYTEAEGVHTEFELCQIAREEGFDIAYLIRSNDDDWAHYEATNWEGLIAWLEENPDHPDKQAVIDWYHKTQDEYMQYGRQYLGWAMYILNPIRY